MTTAQCNRRRRWSCLQCVRDGQRTKDHEKSARHATNKQNQQQYCNRHMTTAMMHGGGGVLLMMTTKFASQRTINKYKNTQSKPLFSQPYPTQNNNTITQAKTTMTTNTLLHQTNLQPRSSRNNQEIQNY